MTERETGGTIAARLGEIQLALRDARLEGWLLYDHRGQNGIAVRALGLDDVAPVRRFFYWVPADGMPALIAHTIELETFGELPGDALRYEGWTSLRARLEKTLPRRGVVAMEHQDIGGSPDLSRVDAGTVELVRSYGPRVVSSADLVNRFLAPWSAAQRASHARTVEKLGEVEGELVAMLEAQRTPLEREVRARADAAMRARGLVVGCPPAITGGPRLRDRSRSGDAERRLAPRDVVTIDLVAREDQRAAPFAHRGIVLAIEEATSEAERAFATAREARDAAIELVRDRARTGARLLGFEVDEHARMVLARSRDAAQHRTGHHLGRVPLSGEGCTFDALEIHDTREALSGLAWSVHPGVYRDDVAVRASASVLRDGERVVALDPGQDAIRVVARGT